MYPASNRAAACSHFVCFTGSATGCVACSGMAGGHYYTYARTLSKVRTAEWYNYNDSYVSKMSADAVRTPAAYMLFYQRREWNGGREGPVDSQPEEDVHVV